MLAAAFCHSLLLNGYDGWHLPAKEELPLIKEAFLEPVTNIEGYLPVAPVEGSLTSVTMEYTGRR